MNTERPDPTNIFKNHKPSATELDLMNGIDVWNQYVLPRDKTISEQAERIKELDNLVHLLNQYDIGEVLPSHVVDLFNSMLKIDPVTDKFVNAIRTPIDILNEVSRYEYGMDFFKLSDSLASSHVAQSAMQIYNRELIVLNNNLRNKVDQSIEVLESVKSALEFYKLNFETSTSLYVKVTDFITDYAKNNDGWISVKERLPDEGQIVLSFGDGKRASLSEFSAGIFYRYIDNVPGDRLMSIYYDKITHWRPLPEPPKTDNAKNKPERHEG